MKLKKLRFPLMAAGIFVCNAVSAQLYIDNAQLFIQSGAVVTVQGDVTSNVDIQGTGKLLLKGSTLQNVSMGGFSIPNLEIDNTSNAKLTTSAKIGSSLLFTNGKITLGTSNLTLTDVATVSGQGTGKFAETDSTGQVIKLLTANVTGYEVPVGIGTNYRPAFITSNGTYSSANVGVRVKAIADPSKPASVSDYLLAYWPITKTGVTGTLTVAGQYIDAADISGTEANLRGYFYNGTDWSSSSETHDNTLNRVSAPVTTASGDVYGMDKFSLLKAKAYLQAVYNSTTGVMTDNLRTAPSVIPLTDPYRSISGFTHVANSTVEVAPASVFADQTSTNDNIVDWVFLELRNTTVSPGNTVLQTRSALLKRSGDIVDIDGVSPVTFNNVANGNYTVAVRHRNHLGISTNPATNLRSLSEQKSTVTLLDFTSAANTDIYGTTAAYGVATDGKRILWAGNANSNGKISFNGLSNDKDYLLTTALAGNAGATINNTYNTADVNMNRKVSFNGLSNDKDYILTTALAGNAGSVKTQALPN